jgi:hypothetical protein
MSECDVETIQKAARVTPVHVIEQVSEDLGAGVHMDSGVGCTVADWHEAGIMRSWERAAVTHRSWSSF